MTAPLQRGEPVDIVIRNAEVVRVRGEGHDGDVQSTVQVAILNADGAEYYTTLPLGWDAITVRRLTVDDTDPISALNFSVRVDNTLRREGIGTVGELVKLNGHELLDIRSFGVTSLAEVIDKLDEHELRLQEPPCPLPDLPTRRALNGGKR